MWTWPLQDGLGSVRSVASDTLAVNGMQHYAPYGDPFGTQGSLAMPFGFTGEQTDGNGLVYLRARHYAPSLGLFPSLDPFEGIPSRPMSLNGYSWVEGNPVMNTDPRGQQVATGFQEIARQTSAVCAGHPYCVAAMYAAMLISVGIRVSAGSYDPYKYQQYEASLREVLEQGLPPNLRDVEEEVIVTLSPQMERAIQEALGRRGGSDEEPEPRPYRPPLPLPVPQPEPDDERDCPTNNPPGSIAPFDSAREMEDIMCNIRKYTAPTGPQPFSWWVALQGGIYPIFGNAWIGIGAAFLGRNPVAFTEVGTLPCNSVTGTRGAMFIPRPGFLGRSRADIMSLVVHELRHAGQFYSLFSNETIRGQRLYCSNISGRIAEVDALLNENHWLVNSIKANLLRVSDIRDSVEALNNGSFFTEDDLWDHPEVRQYQQFYGTNFNTPSCYICPGTPSTITGC